MVYMHAVVAAFPIMLSVVKLLLKGEVGVCALIVKEITLLIVENHGKIMDCVFFNFCGNPV